MGVVKKLGDLNIGGIKLERLRVLCQSGVSITRTQAEARDARLELTRLGRIRRRGTPTLQSTALVLRLSCVCIVRREVPPSFHSIGLVRCQLLEMGDRGDGIFYMAVAQPAETCVELRRAPGSRGLKLMLEYLA